MGIRTTMFLMEALGGGKDCHEMRPLPREACLLDAARNIFALWEKEMGLPIHKKSITKLKA